MNCHYVTRWITEGWEQAPGSLLYFDFSEDKIKRQYSKVLFAETDTNSDEIEGLLNRYIETPLRNLLPLLLQGGDLSITDWSQYRSLFLYFMIQAARYSKAMVSGPSDSDSEHRLDILLKKGEPFLNQIAQADMAKNQIIAVAMPPTQILFFPEVGFFQFPVTDPGCLTGFTFAFGLPITPHIALVRVSKSADIARIFATRNELAGFSIGLDRHSTRVLIPKLIREQRDDVGLTEMMTTQRAAAIAVVSGTQQIRELVAEMYQKVGLTIGA